VRISDAVQTAMDNQQAIVALESTVITHGLPRPLNVHIANQMEAKIRSLGAVPATIAVVHGQICAGLTADELEELALSLQVSKLSTRDLSSAVASSASGGTTVAATAFVAESVGIQVFTTGGIGGVHRGGHGDVSADLGQLRHSQVAVVCAGAKSILDLPRTLEWLETNSIPVLGWQTDEFPAFYAKSSKLPLSHRVNSISEITATLKAHWTMGLGGVLIGIPCPAESAISLSEIERVIEIALDRADQAQIRGNELTPFLLSTLAEMTDGASLQANQALLLNNASMAAQIAIALTSNAEANPGK
jgi:pseudouridine-5'-phosphate glycosidase